MNAWIFLLIIYVILCLLLVGALGFQEVYYRRCFRKYEITIEHLNKVIKSQAGLTNSLRELWDNPEDECWDEL